MTRTRKPSVLVEALMRYSQQSQEEVEAVLDTITPAQKRMVHADPAIAPIIRDVKRERETASGRD